MNDSETAIDSEAVRETVREGYAKIAQDTSAGCCASGVSCCGSSPQDGDKLAKELGYSVEELQALPEGANMGLSCGNPAALAALKPGEVVLDLGSGGGFDVFIAGRKVGATGRAIGVDMTPEMLGKARRNIAQLSQANRLGQRRIPPGRNRASARGRQSRGRHHFQLRHQSFAGQAAGLARNCARAQARRARGGFRHGAAQAVAAGSAQNGGGDGRLRGRRGAGGRNRTHGAGSRA